MQQRNLNMKKSKKKIRHKIEYIRKKKKGEWELAVKVLEEEKRIIKEEFWSKRALTKTNDLATNESNVALIHVLPAGAMPLSTVESKDLLMTLTDDTMPLSGNRLDSEVLSSDAEDIDLEVPSWSFGSGYLGALNTQIQPNIFKSTPMPRMEDLLFQHYVGLRIYYFLKSFFCIF